MSKTVCIEMDDDGTVTVGLEPPEAEAPEAPGAAAPESTETAPAGAGGNEEEAEKSYMQPAKDIDDALRQAKDLLQQPATTDGSPSPFQAGFAKVRPTSPDGNLAGPGY